MDRINKIIKHELYLEFIEKIKVHEEDRKFCKHDMIHFLEVCRLAEIDWLNYRIWELEKQAENFSGNGMIHPELRQNNKELIYAAALLHDIGRWQEYENGVRHELASAQLAPNILEECGFSEDEIEKIVYAIMNHRNKEIAEDISLAGFIYRADKKSRPCYFCEAESECDWSVIKKNLEIC